MHGRPVFDRSHVICDGNSQGGILGGVLIAADQDIERGVPTIVKLDPNFGDQQVTEWSAEVMARTMGIPADYSMSDRVAQNLGTGPRQPDVQRGFGLTPLDYDDPEQTAAGALIVWDDERTAIPPIDNTPPRPEPPLDRDPHDDSAKKFSGRCQKAHFLRDGGKLIDISAVEFAGAAGPGVGGAGPVLPPE